MEKQRLDKIISSAAPFSRREVHALVKSGRVAVDGVTASAADMKIDAEKCEITVDGKKITFRAARYFMLNKPAGYLSATEDERGKTVIELIRPEDRGQGLFPAGRLDKDSEGLLILTDDGELCHEIISPKKKVYKTYYVETAEKLEKSDVEAFAVGITLADGTAFLPGGLEILDGKKAYVKICEGKFHQVKRMLASLGKPVTYLKRISIGGLELDSGLEAGEYRELTKNEIDSIFM